MNINPSDIKISMSHNKDDFVALISKKDTKIQLILSKLTERFLMHWMLKSLKYKNPIPYHH